MQEPMILPLLMDLIIKYENSKAPHSILRVATTKNGKFVPYTPARHDHSHASIHKGTNSKKNPIHTFHTNKA